MSPRPCVAMKLIASDVANCAAMVRSPSFSRSAASTTTTNFPWRTSSIASSMVANGAFVSTCVALDRPRRVRTFRMIVPGAVACGQTQASRRARRDERARRAWRRCRLEVQLVAGFDAAPSVVASRVCGTSATENEPSPSPAIVRLTPSTAIDPFSTQ